MFEAIKCLGLEIYHEHHVLFSVSCKVMVLFDIETEEKLTNQHQLKLGLIFNKYHHLKVFTQQDSPPASTQVMP